MKIKFFATYREITKCKEAYIPTQPDVWSLLHYLSGVYGPEMKAKLFTADGNDIGQDAILLINGRNIAHLGGKNAPILDTDTISLFPMVAGG